LTRPFSLPTRERPPIRRLMIIEMICVGHGRSLFLALTVLLCGSTAIAERTTAVAHASSDSAIAQAVVTLRWGIRPGVSRYRLQLANDANFVDIVFDRVVNGHEYRITDLQPGKYFWRVAPLDHQLGAFSSAGAIDVAETTKSAAAGPAPAQTSSSATASPSVVTQRGWYAAFAGISKPVPVHLRSAQSVDIVATTNDGRLIALDGLSGIALWIRQFAAKAGVASIALAIRDKSGLENVLVSSGTDAALMDGKTGRELWRAALPAGVSSAVAAGDKVFAIDGSLQRLFVINNATKLVSDTRLAGLAVGAPVAFGSSSIIIALADGRIQVFDENGKVTRSGDAAAPITTAPLFVKTPRGQFVLIGTRNGLTALNAEDLRPLGRVTLKDSPQGSLFAQDLDNDGIPEVILFTDIGRVVVVKSDQGKVVWEADAKRADATSFADINGDHALDLLMTGREGSAFALSGRDGALIWKDETPSPVVTNHSASLAQRSSLVVSSPAGVLFIATEPGGGLRALEFPGAIAPRN